VGGYFRQAGWHRRIIPVPAEMLRQDFCFLKESENVYYVKTMAIRNLSLATGKSETNHQMRLLKGDLK
jgi:hypothetical protein